MLSILALGLTSLGDVNLKFETTILGLQPWPRL